MARRLSDRKVASGAVPYWAFLLTVFFICGAMAAGYVVLNTNAGHISGITSQINKKATERDRQLCDQAHINHALTPYVLPKRVRFYIHEFLRDIRRDHAECHPAEAPKVLPSFKSKTTASPHPPVTVTHTVLEPGGKSYTIKVTESASPKPAHHKRHNKSNPNPNPSPGPSHKPKPSPTSVLCIIPPPSPAPRPGGCK